MKGSTTTAVASVGKDSGETLERAAFRINVKDLRILKSLGIDPTRKVRTRRPAARRRPVAASRRAAR
jgi:hypothetical protein